MRKRRPVQLTMVKALILAAGVHLAAAERGAVSIEFLDDGRCAVAAEGTGFHSTMTYTPAASSDSSGEFRCAVPPVPAGTAIDLRVVLASGKRPSGDGAPRLDWVEREGRWIGTGAFESAPDVVVVGDYSGPAAVRARWTRRGFAGAGVLAAVALVGFAARRVRRRP